MISTYPSKTAVERTADFAVHAVSLVGFSIASVFLVLMTLNGGDDRLIAASVVYALAVLLSVCVSFAYHLLPKHNWRATLRRWDHAAIYPVIAGTFTPLLIVAGTWSAFAILAVIWSLAMLGIIFKLVATDMNPRWSVMSYLGLGAFALIALPDFWTQLPRHTTVAIGGGALFYTIGTWFYRQKEMRFRYPIWHALGTVGGLFFLAAIWIAIADRVA